MEVPHQLRVAIELAREKETAGGEMGDFASEMSRRLAAAIHELEAGDAPLRPSRRKTGALEYVIEGDATAQMLTEYRLSGKSKPFRCPKAVYDGVATILSEAESPLSVEEIASSFEARTGSRPPEFQLRVPLRLWTQGTKPIVLRSRARYFADTRIDMQTKSTEVWRQLKNE